MVLRGSGKSVSDQRNSSGANSCHCFSFALLCKLNLFWDQKSRMPLASFGEAGRLRDDFSVITRAFLRGGRFRQNDAAGKSEVVGTFPQDLSGETNFASPWIPPNPVQDLNGKSTAYHSAQPCAVLMLWTAFYRNMQETCMNLASTKMYKDVQSQLSFFTQFQGWMSGVSLFSGL